MRIVQFPVGSIIVSTNPWTKLLTLGTNHYKVLEVRPYPSTLVEDIGKDVMVSILESSGWKIDEASQVELTLSKYEALQDM